MDNNLTKVAIVHEATHAYMDYRRSNGNVYVEESACYIAERIYAEKPPRVPFSVRSDPKLMEALRIVRDHDMVVRNGVRLSWNDFARLRRALRQVPSYIRANWAGGYTNDGIPR